MNKTHAARWPVAFLITVTALLALQLSASVAEARNKRLTGGSLLNVRLKPSSVKAAARAATSCNRCAVNVSAKGRNLRAGRKANQAKVARCRLKGQVNPRIARNYNKALTEIKRAGYNPAITSTWRSQEEQARLYNCTRNRRCRRANPGLYGARPPGTSLHEAGLAVDVSGIATGRRGSRRLTPRGRKIVSIMRKNGFNWRYGLADPAHFEADPRRAGYRNLNQAIKRSKPRCSVNIASDVKASRKRSNARNVSLRKASNLSARSKAARPS
jgi:hypothetical protein